MMTDEQLDAIRAREQAATKGPWYAHDMHHRHAEECGALVSTSEVYGGTEGGGTELFDSFNRGHKVSLVRHDDDGGWHDEAGYKDLEFAAHARQDVPSLLAEVDRLRSRVTELQNANNAEVERRRAVEDELRKAREYMPEAVAARVLRQEIARFRGPVRDVSREDGK